MRRRRFLPAPARDGIESREFDRPLGVPGA